MKTNIDVSLIEKGMCGLGELLATLMVSFNTDRAYSDNDPPTTEVAAMHWAMKNKVKKGIKRVIF